MFNQIEVMIAEITALLKLLGAFPGTCSFTVCSFSMKVFTQVIMNCGGEKYIILATRSFV